MRMCQRVVVLFIRCAALGVVCNACSAGGGAAPAFGGSTGGSSSGGNATGGAVTSTGGNGTGGELLVISTSSGGSSPDASTAGGPFFRDDCAAGPVTPNVVTALQAGGPPGAMKYLYPYDGTVFPRGILPPLLQWAPAGGAADAVYLHMKASQFEYKACFGPTDPARIAIPRDVWAMATEKSLGAKDPLTVQITTKAGSTVNGPINEQLMVALGSLKGTVYYNTYDSTLAGGPAGQQKGAVMKIAAGSDTATVFVTTDTGCISCHSVSANGATLLAAHHYIPIAIGTDTSDSYDLSSRPATAPPILKADLDEAGFGGLYPDGKKFMSMGTSAFGEAVTMAGTVTGMAGPRDAKLFDTTTGAQITANGWDGVVHHAQMPMFSPDGTKIAFNDTDNGSGHSLSVMDFDNASNTFSKEIEIFRDPDNYPGWPFFTPDNASVILALSNAAGSDFTTFNSNTARGELYIVDVASHKATRLSIADGLRNGALYLPGGSRDDQLSFYTTVHPIAVGGYAWVFFTSLRTYGNVITDPLPPNGAGLFTIGSTTANRAKKIWVTAVDLGAPPGTDPSHPAFYLPGQEQDTGNHRAFSTLDPCTGDGTKCGDGTDCCTGYCTNGICGEPAPRCSNVNEKCTTDNDCCQGTRLRCIGSFCGIPQPT